MNAIEIMDKYAPLFRATHIQFDQQWLLPHLTEKNKQGVCAALVLRWLKSSHKRGFLVDSKRGVAHNPVKVSYIDQKQLELSKNKYGDEFIGKFTAGNRDTGGFGSLNLTRIGDPFIASTVLGDIKGYDLIPTTARILWEVHQNCGATLSFDSDTMEDRHMVGAYKVPGEFTFFDPNGGLMIFKNPDDFYDWFHKHFFQADDYKGFRWAKFVYYQIG